MRLWSMMKSSLSGTRRRLVLGRNRATILGDEEVVLHEAFDILHAGMRGIAESNSDLALHVERQPFFGATGEEVDVATHRPQEVGAAAEGAVFLRVEHAALEQLVGLA